MQGEHLTRMIDTWWHRLDQHHTRKWQFETTNKDHGVWLNVPGWDAPLDASGVE
jgi:hypothetical protein